MIGYCHLNVISAPAPEKAFHEKERDPKRAPRQIRVCTRCYRIETGEENDRD